MSSFPHTNECSHQMPVGQCNGIRHHFNKFRPTIAHNFQFHLSIYFIHHRSVYSTCHYKQAMMKLIVFTLFTFVSAIQAVERRTKALKTNAAKVQVRWQLIPMIDERIM